MPIVLARVDDRLVHGQVVIGWGRVLDVGRIVLVDDTVAASPWEQDLYRMAVPDELELRFATPAEAFPKLAEWQSSPTRTMLLTGDVDTMAALVRAAPDVVRRVNLGGIHHRPGRPERLPYVYLADEELRMLEALETEGAEVTAQDLPTTPATRLRSLR
jgi:PTS system mannose-specific IIB component/fructoselysine and glucoselysine-specific PTS system IIB component